MNLHDYELVKNYDYSTYCKYLLEKYGAVGGDYFSANFTPNASIKRRDENLFVHHMREDKVANLSNVDVARANDFEYQKAHNLVYANLLEHILLHIMIGEQNYTLGFDGARLMISQANDYISDAEDYAIVLEALKTKLRNCLASWDTILQHNITVFHELDDALKQYDRVLGVVGTGLGKTSTGLAYIRKYGMRGLVLGPNRVITDEWEKEEDVDAYTYQWFMNNYKTIDYSKYGVIICDEAHHCAAPKWGEGIRYVLDNGLIKVMGLTATPKENKEKKNLETSREFFQNHVCQGFTVLDGIEREIIHDFSYVGAIYDTTGIKEKYADISDKTLLGELDLALNNTPTVKTIITKHMPSNKRKGIIFVSDIDAMGEAEEIMRDIYPNAEYRRMHSRMSNNEIKNAREWFQDTDEGYLLAVNMISEGAHYKGVNTIIMFRRTQSSLVFNQQLGRIITLARDEDPHAIVFDLVNNAENLDTEKGFSASLRESYGKRKARGGKEKSDQIIVEDYAEAISDVLRKIKEGLCNPTKPIILIELQKVYPSWHEPSQEFDVTRKAIQNACLDKSATCAGYHWAYADDKERIASLSCYIGNVRKTTEVICKEYPNQVFANAKEAEDVTGDERKQINACCQHTKGSVNGRHYAFYWEFLQKGESVFVQENKRNGKFKRKVRCIETGEIFESATAAAKWLGLGSDSVAACCRNRERGKITIAGGYHWEYLN